MPLRLRFLDQRAQVAAVLRRSRAPREEREHVVADRRPCRRRRRAPAPRRRGRRASASRRCSRAPAGSARDQRQRVGDRAGAERRMVERRRRDRRSARTAGARVALCSVQSLAKVPTVSENVPWTKHQQRPAVGRGRHRVELAAAALRAARARRRESSVDAGVDLAVDLLRDRRGGELGRRILGDAGRAPGSRSGAPGPSSRAWRRASLRLRGPGQPSCAGTTTSLPASPRVRLAPSALRVADALCARIRSRASAGCRTSVGPLATLRTTTSSPGRARDAHRLAGAALACRRAPTP